ncbi:MAG: transporter substrate-binding domain-containing protein [Tannerellaceae bacterium]|jgi:membrane-bound lytic murein transglycosylase MltF|nr:transporter substrate-binding domain-containing protein [Tannerellaceae bacterium]
MKLRKQLVLYICLLLVAVIAMLMLRQAPFTVKSPGHRDYAEIREEGILRIMTEYNPSGYYISGDTIEGFQYELSRAIAEISGLEVQIRLEMNLTESFRALSGNECDILAQNIPATSEMKESYLFTEPIVLSKQILTQRTPEANNGVEPVRNHLELAGKTIYVPKDSPALLRLKHLESEIGDTVYIMEEDTYSSEQLVIMVAKGEIDYAVCDRQVAATLRNEFPEIDMETDISFTQLQAWALRKDATALADSLNHWFDRMRKNGTFDVIYKRYYNNPR